MKRLIIFTFFFTATLSLFSQRIGYRKDYSQPVTVQVVPTILNFEGIKYGVAIGANFRQIVSVNYFFVRDYKYGNHFTDGFYNGFHINAVLPITETIEFGGGIRTGKLMTSGDLYAQKQGPILTSELRIKISDGLRIAFEYGQSKKQHPETGKGRNRPVTSLRFMFNLY